MQWISINKIHKHSGCLMPFMWKKYKCLIMSEHSVSMYQNKISLEVNNIKYKVVC